MCTEAYVAAFIDGEGCIQVRTSGWPRVLVSNTDRGVLEEMCQEMGAGFVRLLNLKAPGNRRPCWYWSCHGREAVKLLRQVLPWLRIKRELAEKAVLYHWYPPGHPTQDRRVASAILQRDLLSR